LILSCHKEDKEDIDYDIGDRAYTLYSGKAVKGQLLFWRDEGLWRKQGVEKGPIDRTISKRITALVLRQASWPVGTSCSITTILF